MRAVELRGGLEQFVTPVGGHVPHTPHHVRLLVAPGLFLIFFVITVWDYARQLNPVSLAQRVDGVLSELSVPQSFEVVQMTTGALPAQDQSESAAFLLQRGIEASAPLYDRISGVTEQISNLRAELGGSHASGGFALTRPRDNPYRERLSLLINRKRRSK